MARAWSGESLLATVKAFARSIDGCLVHHGFQTSDGSRARGEGKSSSWVTGTSGITCAAPPFGAPGSACGTPSVPRRAGWSVRPCVGRRATRLPAVPQVAGLPRFVPGQHPPKKLNKPGNGG